MNKLKYLLFAIAAVLLSCTDQAKTYRIGVSQCGSGQWREKVNQEILAAQHLYEQNVQVSIACAYDDTERQIEQIDSLVSTGIDLLVVAPNEAAPVSAVIAKARKRGIPVIYFDRRAENEDFTAFIGGNNIQSGQAMGTYVEHLLREQPAGRVPRVLEITGSIASSPAKERHEGFAKVMEGITGADYSWRDGKWTSDEACAIVEQMMTDGRTPDIVFCHNDGMATGVYKAVVEKNMEGQIKILGIDGLPDEGIEYVLLGHQVGSYIYPTHGELIVRLALDILTGRPYERINYLQGMVVTPDNAELLSLNSKELIRQSHDLITIHDKLEDYFGLYNTQRKVLMGSFAGLVVLAVALLMMWRAYIETRKTIRQRQHQNIEEALFYSNPDNRRLRQVFEIPEEEKPTPRSQDAIFAETLNEVIRGKMSNPNLKMEELGDEMGLSRVQLYRKVKSITGQSPVELLRHMRLQRGYILLTSTTKTVNEIAYEVGFGTPGYFSKCFKKEYGKLPMEVRSEQI